jgi:hypothetical protein
MKRFGKFFVYAAILLSLAIGGCGFDLPLDADGGAAVDPTLSPPPAGRVWVKIPVPDDTARTLTGTDNPIFINYYEVYFYERTKDYLFTGTAKKGEQLVVSVIPGVTYEVLLVAGDSVTKTLLASSYNGSASIESGKINQVDLVLDYVKSDPAKGAPSDFTFTHTDVDPPIYDGFPSVSLYYVVDAVTVDGTNSGSNYAIDDTVKVLPTGIPINGSTGEVVLKITAVTGGSVTAAEVVQNGFWGVEPTGSDLSATNVSASGTDTLKFDLTFKQEGDATIPENIPWLTYEGAGATRTNDLKFKITTRGLEPIISAGGSGGSGEAHFSLEKAEFQLDPLINPSYKYEPIGSVKDETTAFASPFVLDTTPEAATASDSITLEYTLNKGALPTVNTYGMVYYRLSYKPFGGKGNAWSIRNGLDLIELDEGPRTRGSGVLVKIGDPGLFTSWVTVQVNN